MRKLISKFGSITVALLLVSLFVYLVVSYVNSNSDSIWNSVKIDIVDTDKYSFVSELDVRNVINDFNYTIEKTHIDSIDIYSIKERLLENNYINKVSVYTGIDGSLNVVVSQFEPVLTINTPVGLYMLNVDGESVLVNGIINVDIPYITTENRYNEFNKFYRNSINNDISIADIVGIICNFANRIRNDNLLSNLIVQININLKGEIELIPRFGADIVVLCDLVDLEKCDNYIYKLKRFYENISSENNLEVFSVVNVKYKNQVVPNNK